MKMQMQFRIPGKAMVHQIFTNRINSENQLRAAYAAFFIKFYVIKLFS